MATKTDIVDIARNYLRDFPRFVQATFEPNTRTYDIGRPNIDADLLWVAYIPQGGTQASAFAATDYSLDARNGLLRFVNPLPAADSVLIEGYYYEWLTPADLNFYADIAIHLNTHNLDIALVDMAPAVADVVGIHTLVQALWGLLSEYSRDIDVFSSEATHIPASQRYRMVSDLLKGWVDEYNKRAQALNMGLERIEVLNLRRVSRTTNRLVPLYKPREVGDYSPIERLWPPIDDGVIDLQDDNDDLREDVYMDLEPLSVFLTTGYF